jgi:hypothetical protein
LEGKLNKEVAKGAAIAAEEAGRFASAMEASQQRHDSELEEKDSAIARMQVGGPSESRQRAVREPSESRQRAVREPLESR